MILFKKAAALTAHLKKLQSRRVSIGFVPTMGALHAGHISLLKASRQQNEIAVASIFVNPAQFNDKKDFEKYPVTLEKDIEMLVAAGCDVLFLPSVNEMYPNGYSTRPHYDLGYLETILEGKYRPGHFQGVCRVMDRLLTLVQPDNLYMGQKDYQQCMVVKRLLNLISLNTRLHTCPTLRESDGLAMSSRNARLNAVARENAVVISVTLEHIRENIQPGNLASIVHDSMALLNAKQCKVDYIAIADAETLALLTEWDGVQKIVALIAAFQQDVRLIDNMLLN